MYHPAAEWVGVVTVGPFSVDCRLFSSSGKTRPFPLRFVHRFCHTSLEPIGTTVVETREEKIEASKEKSEIAVAREQFFCPKCRRALKTDEIGRAAETASGLVELSDEELLKLEFKPMKRVVAEIIAADDPALETVGFSRRLYVLPKPVALPEYAGLYHTLLQSGRLGFIPLLVIKRKPYVGVIKPLHIPPSVFGAEREVLVVDVLNDTEQLKDPGELPDFFGAMPELRIADLAPAIAAAQRSVVGLDPERCINPKRRSLRDIIKKAMARTLK